MSSTAPSTEYAGTLEHMDPRVLMIRRNIRDAKPDPDLVRSIKAVGVLEPITVVRDTKAGEIVVRFGHRRALAAVEAGLETVPCYIAGDDSTEDDAEVDRIVAQFDENTQRTGLTASDEVNVVEQLAAFGLSAGQMVKRTRLDKSRVDTALAVSGSELARKATEKYESLTLDQAAAVAEFESDAEVAKELIVTAIQNPERFAHAAQRKRDDRDRAQLIVDARDKLAVAGVKVLAERPGAWGSKTKGKSVHSLVDESGKGITDKAHAKCPGHAVFLTADVRGRKVVEEAHCTDPKKNGHRDRYATSSSTPAAGLSDKEREAAKKARALVVENNKQWESASTVRREWISTFAKVKTPPKGTAAFLAHAIASDLRGLLDYQYNHLAADWLAAAPNANLGKSADKATEGRALVVALVQVLGRYEASLRKDDWRHDGTNHAVGRYLRYLESAGYPLSDVEKFAISKKTA